MIWLPDGEKILMLCLFVLTQSTNVTDRQTDTAWRHRLRLCIASRGKNEHKNSNLAIPLNSHDTSRTHAVRKQRFEDDRIILWRKENLTPSHAKPLNQSIPLNYVIDIYPYAKFYPDPFRGSFYPYVWRCASPGSAIFLLSLVQARCLHGFWHAICQKMCFHALNLPFWS